MKKIYLLSLLCFISFGAFAQFTATIYATGAAGSYITGNTDGTTRIDDNIVSGNVPTVDNGYAVFDLSGIPAGAIIQSATIGFYVTTYGGAGTPSGWNTYGYPGDLSTITVPAALFAQMTTLPATSISTATYGTTVGNQTIASTAPITSFITANIGSKVSIAWTGGGTRTYTIKGESGVTTSTVAVNHAPYLQIVYCAVPTAPSATATPNPICTGATLTLNGTATYTTGILGYSWTGPGGFTSGLASPTSVVTLTSAGVYSVAITHVCGTYTTTPVYAATASVTVNPSPAAITGNNAVCAPGSGFSTTTLSDATGTGTWISQNTTIATVVSGSGLVTGKAIGTTNISYVMPVTGCYALLSMAINAPPAAITGPVTSMCQGATTTLAEPAGGGAWTTTNTNIATVTSGTVTGLLTGGGGPVTIDYTIIGCPAATYAMTINPTPGPIMGGPDVCIGTPSLMSDALGGGTWTASNTNASFGTGFFKNDLFGTTVGLDTITYTITATGCFDTLTVSVLNGPGPITGGSVVCVGSSISLSDAGGPGGWTSSSTVASISGGSGILTGVAAGMADITFSPLSSTCIATEKVTVNPQPSPIAYLGASPNFCENDSLQVSDPDPLGKWTSSNTAIPIDTSTRWITASASGSTTISYTFPSTGCASTLVVNVYPVPSDVVSKSGPTTFCSGGSVTLSVLPGGGGTTYQWYNGGVAIPTAVTTSYTTSTTQDLSVQITNPSGCTVISAPVQVIAGISPTVDTSGPAHFCFGSHVIITANPNGAVGVITYQWQLNGVDIPSATANNYPAGNTGNYTCIVTVSGGGSGSCAAATQTVSVTATPLPTPTITYTRETSGTIFSTGTGYSAYQWLVNAVAIPGAVYHSYTAVDNGSYRVLVTDSTGCSGYSDEYIVNDVAVAQINKATDIKIFPNPAASVVHIESSVPVHAVITGIEGKVLIDEANASDINISSLASGLYMILLYDENGERIMVEKLIKQ